MTSPSFADIDIDAFMAIGAHCDDVEVLVGGTFARLVREGKRGCYVVAVENAHVGEHYTVNSSREALDLRRAETTNASKILGADRLEWLQFKSYYFSIDEAGPRIFVSFDSPEKVAEELEGAIFEGLPPIANAPVFQRCRDRLISLIHDFKPQVIFTNSPLDRHPDHYSMCRFVDFIVEELRQQGEEIPLYCWPCGSGGPIVEHRPDLLIELSEEDVMKKQQAIDCYPSQIEEGSAPDYAVKTARGYGALAGLEYAEGFQRAGGGRKGFRGKGKSDVLEAIEKQDLSFDIYRLPLPTSVNSG